MKPSNIYKKVQSLWIEVSSQEEATKYYDWLKNALEGIQDTRWLQEIQEYWLREYDSAVQKLGEVDANDIAKIAILQATINNARKFLDFLRNILGE